MKNIFLIPLCWGILLSSSAFALSDWHCESNETKAFMTHIQKRYKHVKRTQAAHQRLKRYFEDESRSIKQVQNELKVGLSVSGFLLASTGIGAIFAAEGLLATGSTKIFLMSSMLGVQASATVVPLFLSTQLKKKRNHIENDILKLTVFDEGHGPLHKHDLDIREIDKSYKRIYPAIYLTISRAFDKQLDKIEEDTIIDFLATRSKAYMDLSFTKAYVMNRLYQREKKLIEAIIMHYNMNCNSALKL